MISTMVPVSVIVANANRDGKPRERIFRQVASVSRHPDGKEEAHACGRFRLGNMLCILFDEFTLSILYTSSVPCKAKEGETEEKGKETRLEPFSSSRSLFRTSVRPFFPSGIRLQ